MEELQFKGKLITGQKALELIAQGRSDEIYVAWNGINNIEKRDSNIVFRPMGHRDLDTNTLMDIENSAYLWVRRV